MTIQINIPTDPIKKLLWSILLLFLVSVIFFSCWYLASSYHCLVQWYYRLNNCFYRSGYWASDFFTQKVKSTGNVYCIAAIAVSIACIAIILRRFRRHTKLSSGKATLLFTTTDLIQGAIVIATAVILWLWANTLAAPSNDEVFSAVNCAGIHPFQTVSYYMLPNNHVFFNTLNNLIFHAVENKTLTGRILSLAFYILLLISVLGLMRRLISNKWLALMASLTLSMQFPIWGFGSQGRGYELLALCEWITLLSFLKYKSTHNRDWLYVMAVAICCGYFTIPVFMYFHMAVLLFSGYLQLASRKIDFQFWGIQLCCGVITFLLYLPCLTFSGLQAITGNPWLTITQPYAQLWHDLVDTCHEFMDYCFCNIGRGNYLPDLLFFLLPFTLLFYRKNNRARLLGAFYCCMWGILILFTLKMKVFPMDRALPGQFSVTLALMIYALYLGMTTIMSRMLPYIVPVIVVAAVLAFMDINFLEKDKKHITHYQCHFPVNQWNEILTGGIKSFIPCGSSVGFSDESFYWYFLCRKMGYPVSRCPSGNEQFFIKLGNEPFPYAGEESFSLMTTVGDYHIYRRK